MKISVIIPTFNRTDFICKTIESVLNQTVKADEIIVVDDGSTDDTQKKVKQYDITYIYQENSGVSSARNQGIKKSKNEWIAFLDSDDIWLCDKLKSQIKFHKQNQNILISHTNERWIRDSKELKQKSHHQKPSGFCFLDNISFCKIGPSTVIMHKSIFDNIGYFDEDLRLCEDYDLWLRVTQNYKIGYIDKKLTHKIAGHDDQLSFSTFGLDRFRIAALEKHIDSKYKTQILNELIKKCNILLKGAHKHQNHELIRVYTNKLAIFDKKLNSY